MKIWKEQGVKAQTCITSPPYFGLRDYGTATYEGGDTNCIHTISGWSDNLKPDCDRPERDGKKRQFCLKCGAKRIDQQIGMEETPEDYIKAMVDVFRCVWDVLEDDGTLWLNIGDSYASNTSAGDKTFGNPEFNKNRPSRAATKTAAKSVPNGCKPKDLIGIPWMLAFALRADGWYLRQDIIWHKPNPMPESVKDRCTKSHEYIFLFSKKPKYYFDSEAIKEKAVTGDGEDMRNKRDVWTVNLKPYKEAHFATFPTQLIEPCVLAGSRINDIVLDPFMGSGTTAKVAKEYGRRYIGCELNEEYRELQNKRLTNPT